MRKEGDALEEEVALHWHHTSIAVKTQQESAVLPPVTAKRFIRHLMELEPQSGPGPVVMARSSRMTPRNSAVTVKGKLHNTKD